jgi:hypothetical protein
LAYVPSGVLIRARFFEFKDLLLLSFSLKKSSSSESRVRFEGDMGGSSEGSN